MREPEGDLDCVVVRFSHGVIEKFIGLDCKGVGFLDWNDNRKHLEQYNHDIDAHIEYAADVKYLFNVSICT